MDECKCGMNINDYLNDELSGNSLALQKEILINIHKVCRKEISINNIKNKIREMTLWRWDTMVKPRKFIKENETQLSYFMEVTSNSDYYDYENYLRCCTVNEMNKNCLKCCVINDNYEMFKNILKVKEYIPRDGCLYSGYSSKVDYDMCIDEVIELCIELKNEKILKLIFHNYYSDYFYDKIMEFINDERNNEAEYIYKIYNLEIMKFFLEIRDKITNEQSFIKFCDDHKEEILYNPMFYCEIAITNSEKIFEYFVSISKERGHDYKDMESALTSMVLRLNNSDHNVDLEKCTINEKKIVLIYDAWNMRYCSESYFIFILSNIINRGIYSTMIFDKILSTADISDKVIKLLFVRACELNNINVILYFCNSVYFDKIMEPKFSDKIFGCACISENIKTFEIIFSSKNFNKNIDVEEHIKLCRSEDVIIWIINNMNNIKPSIISELFRYACYINNYGMVKKIMNHHLFDRTKLKNLDEEFRYVCSVNNIEFAKFLYDFNCPKSIIGKIMFCCFNENTIYNTNNKEYINAMTKYHREMAEWLYSLGNVDKNVYLKY